MKHNRGYLSDFFSGIAVKRLSAVEAHPERSNQHEFNGTLPLKKIMGTERKSQIKACFLWLPDKQEERKAVPGFLTWYDARENHPRRSEHRLYFPTNEVSSQANEGDFVFICQRPNDEVLVIISPQNSSTAMQLLWLFGIEEPGLGFESAVLSGKDDVQLGFAAELILDELGIEVEQPADNNIEGLIEQFGTAFPSTNVFSELARSTCAKVSVIEDPDDALLQWVTHEEKLFRALEKKVLSEKIKTGFMDQGNADVDGFISFSLSAQNRRKSRAGSALESHLQTILKQNALKFSKGAITENRSKPDFLFPGIDEYRNPDFPEASLFMLAVKTTCKDRWRQILPEAQRILHKHLFTLEPGISTFQTDEMKAHSVSLVIPKELHRTYKFEQQADLITLKDWLSRVKKTQGV